MSGGNITLLLGKSVRYRPPDITAYEEKDAWEGIVSETQGYKKHPVFSLPLGGLDITRSLFIQWLKAVEAVVNDPNAKRVFSRNELSAMAFECLMLGKMFKTMPEAAHG